MKFHNLSAGCSIASIISVSIISTESSPTFTKMRRPDWVRSAKSRRGTGILAPLVVRMVKGIKGARFMTSRMPSMLTPDCKAELRADATARFPRRRDEENVTVA